MLVDHNDNCITEVKLKFFQAKIEAESTTLQHLQTELSTDFCSQEEY
jgi:hypothetical protein